MVRKDRRVQGVSLHSRVEGEGYTRHTLRHLHQAHLWKGDVDSFGTQRTRIDGQAIACLPLALVVPYLVPLRSSSTTHYSKGLVTPDTPCDPHCIHTPRIATLLLYSRSERRSCMISGCFPRACNARRRHIYTSCTCTPISFAICAPSSSRKYV